ncbi:ATP phosphoribosyltransferase (homohexameric) [Trichormus variabilis ATCC 29413]|uniref:ATP phosphoribosyltransferase n=2 Tax=Anabaena variabilis TaxID=264691 RepID=HIS1_TRIV2|nr:MULTISPECIES: ATP phosphoribosyltransferase [Nostocaceae]Q3M4Z2.1 RecName: Full=ATP phosphoribosyltransferase; Short=ATP-PRT; Short=ATP-PRTase [Trichormus variabilis ATCC 29413]ABA23944.1 ATP phosphoribosyltransferase (homohexameric) [Trichormus variabilis ATCC 29413]MBC1217263.1 ATP phosphoribosyltransferase [Trichormus variabilis ARAD]MBC1257904.1 ATP phosphoribosyltransferase [Trichormus variabilis V5]MBC1270075.1 ATP phosphoribosyltransferase [Trichormus variabilis FSR]MBC1303153.1 ATP
MLTVALPKGELLKNSIRLLKSVGLDFSAFLDSGNRQLQITDASGRAKGLLVRGQDVPVYVEYGQAQIGIIGYDVLREKQPQVAHLVDLQFGYCRMSVAVKASSPYKSPLDLPAHSRVASKYVNSAREFFQGLDLPVEIVPLYGSVELGPITGMSEAIVDIVSTGRTLKENGLVEITTLYESTARLIAHPLSYRLNTGNLHQLVEQLREGVLSELPILT